MADFRKALGDSLDYPVIRGLAAVLEARCSFASAMPKIGGRGPVAILTNICTDPFKYP
jgi:hypothetical protein